MSVQGRPRVVAGRRDRWRGIIFRVGRGGLRLVLVLLVLELCLRGHHWWTGQLRFHQIDRAIGYRMPAHLKRIFRESDGCYAIETNSRGYRDNEHALEPKEGVARAAMIGSSTLVGMGVSRALMFASLLEEIVPESEIINFGTPATAADQHAIVLRDECLKYHPSVVYFFLSFTDEVESFWPWHLFVARPKCWLKYDLDKISIQLPIYHAWTNIAASSEVCETGTHIAGFFVHVMGFVGEDLHGYLGGQPLTRAQRKEALRLLLLWSRDLCESQGARFVAVYLPTQLELFNTINEREPCWLYRELLPELAQRNGMDVIDLMKPLKDNIKMVGDIETQFRAHFDWRGHEVIAQRLARHLKSLKDSHPTRRPGGTKTKASRTNVNAGGGFS